MSKTSEGTAIDAVLARWMPAMSRVAKVAIAGVLALNVAMLAGYLAFGYRALLNSDAAAKSLLAQEMLATGHVFPPDWNYVNGDLMVLFGQWFVWPVLGVLGNGYAAYAWSSMVSAALVLLATWWAARLVVADRWPRLALLAIVASGLSRTSFDALFGQVSYGNVYFLGCFGLVAAWGAMERTGRARTVRLVVFGLLSLGLYWGNPQRALASFGLPLLAAIAWQIACARDHRAALRAARATLAVFFATMVVGALLHARTLIGVQNHLGAGNAMWLPFDGMVSNAVNTVQGLLALMGCVPTAGVSITSVPGLVQAIRLFAGVGAIVLLPMAIAWSLRMARPASVRYFGMFTFVSFAIVLVLQVTTTIPDMRDPVESARYLLPPLLCALILVVGMAWDATTNALTRAVGAGVILVLATSLLAPNNPVRDVLHARQPDPRMALVERLHREGLSYGYATYWNAGAMTIVSDHRVRVRQISVVRGLPVPMRHLGSNAWYRPAAWNGPTFLLLEPAEVKAVDWEAMQRYLGAPQRQFEANGFQVVVYARNPAGVLPAWDDDLSNPLSLPMTSTSLHIVGAYDPQSRALVAQAGEAGALHFGPYLPLPKGTYQATFDVECDRPAPGACGKVDVSGASGTRVFGEAPIPAGARARVNVRFTVADNTGDAELRVFTDGGGRVALRGITLQRSERR